MKEIEDEEDIFQEEEESVDGPPEDGNREVAN